MVSYYYVFARREQIISENIVQLLTNLELQFYIENIIISSSMFLEQESRFNYNQSSLMSDFLYFTFSNLSSFTETIHKVHIIYI